MHFGRETNNIDIEDGLKRKGKASFDSGLDSWFDTDPAREEDRNAVFIV